MESLFYTHSIILLITINHSICQKKSMLRVENMT